MEIIMKKTIGFIWKSIINQFHAPVTSWDYVLFTICILCGILVLVFALVVAFIIASFL